jgi:hypothetical protein
MYRQSPALSKQILTLTENWYTFSAVISLAMYLYLDIKQMSSYSYFSRSDVMITGVPGEKN